MYLLSACASGSVVERLLAKEKVAGSIPVSRFFNARKKRDLHDYDHKELYFGYIAGPFFWH